jgi:hypothetical protein
MAERGALALLQAVAQATREEVEHLRDAGGELDDEGLDAVLRRRGIELLEAAEAVLAPIGTGNDAGGTRASAVRLRPFGRWPKPGVVCGAEYRDLYEQAEGIAADHHDDPALRDAALVAMLQTYADWPSYLLGLTDQMP